MDNYMVIMYLLMIGVAGTIIFKKDSFGVALPITIMFHVMLVIIGGLLFGDLRLGVYFGIAALFVVVLKKALLNHDYKSVIKVLLSSDTIIFILIYITLFLLNQRQAYSDWDEFSHWGPMAKEMFRLNTFYFKSDRTFAHMDYVPFVTVFEYIICLISGGYSENLIYQGVQIFMISLFMPLLGTIKSTVDRWYKYLLLLLSVVIIFSFAILLNDCFSFMHSIYNDLPFGLLCGFAMAYCYFRDWQSEIDTSIVIDV